MTEELQKPNPSPEQFAALQEELQKLKANNAKLLDQNIKAKEAGKAIPPDVDVNALMSYELERLAHKYSIEMVSILQAYLPAILDGVMSDLRLQADKKYKCALLEGTKIEDDCK